MISYRLPVVFATCVTCLSFPLNYSNASTLALRFSHPEMFTVAQAQSQDLSDKPLFKPGDRGDAVKILQNKLKQKGYLEEQ